MKSEVYILEDNQEYELVDSIEEKNAKYLEKYEIFLIFAHKNTLMNN